MRPELPRIVTPSAPGPGRAPARSRAHAGAADRAVRDDGVPGGRRLPAAWACRGAAIPVAGGRHAPHRPALRPASRALARRPPGRRSRRRRRAPRSVPRPTAGSCSPARSAGAGVVSVTHTGGLRTTYEPVTPAVAAGDLVSAGDILGTLDAGHGGCPAACLHWGLRRGDVYLDPLLLLGLGRMRLKPLVPPGRAARSPPDRAAPAAVRLRPGENVAWAQAGKWRSARRTSAVSARGPPCTLPAVARLVRRRCRRAVVARRRAGPAASAQLRRGRRAGVRRGGRTRRPGCRPVRSAAASHGRRTW